MSHSQSNPDSPFYVSDVDLANFEARAPRVGQLSKGDLHAELVHLLDLQGGKSWTKDIRAARQHMKKHVPEHHIYERDLFYDLVRVGLSPDPVVAGKPETSPLMEVFAKARSWLNEWHEADKPHHESQHQGATARIHHERDAKAVLKAVMDDHNLPEETQIKVAKSVVRHGIEWRHARETQQMVAF